MKKTILTVLISLIVVILVVVGLVFLLNGSTTTSGTKIADKKSEILICENENISYPKLSNYKNPSTDIKITVIFDQRILGSVGLIYTMYYANEDEVSAANNVLNVDLGMNLIDSGLDDSALSNKFNTYKNRLILNLSAKNDELNNGSMPYFLINTSEKQLSNWTIEDYANNYTTQGFSCEKS